MKAQNSKFKIQNSKLTISLQPSAFSLKNMLLFATVIFMLGLSACKKDKDDAPSGKYSKGVFITNEGPFQTGTGTVSFLNRDENTIENDIFELVNNRPLGNIVQSLTVINNKAYIVVNNAGRIEVANADDFSEVAVIIGLNFPRYIIDGGNGKAYISQWGSSGSDGEVKVLDLSSSNIVKTISTGGAGADRMLKKGNNIYVVNNGAFGSDSTVAVISTGSDSKTASIAVGQNPNSIVQDASGNIWVLCGGKWKSDFSGLEVKGSLHKIDASNNVVTTFNFDSEFSQPSNLITDASGNTLYYAYDGKIYSQSATAGSLQLNELVSRSLYALSFDPLSNYIYGGDAGNFASNGKVLRYTTTGAVVDSFEAGIAPNGFFFR